MTTYFFKLCHVLRLQRLQKCVTVLANTHIVMTILEASWHNVYIRCSLSFILGATGLKTKTG